MTILTTITALQALHAAVDGVQTAPTVYPGKLNSADLPMVLVLPAEGTIDLESFGALKRHDGIYRVYVYIAPLTEGTPVNEGMQTAIVLMQSLFDTYLDTDNIALTNGAYQATLMVGKDNPVRHSAIATLSFGEVSYRGFTVDVGIREKW